MDDKPLHDLLDGALVGEPPIGPVGQGSLAAGIRLRRRRRRIRAVAATAAAVAVIAVAIPVGLGAFGHSVRSAGPHQPPPILYIYGWNYRTGEYTGPLGSSVTPVNTATNTPGTPIHVGRGGLGGFTLGQIAITPDGKTAYITGRRGTVTPINTATNTPGAPIHIRGGDTARSRSPRTGRPSTSPPGRVRSPRSARPPTPPARRSTSAAARAAASARSRSPRMARPPTSPPHRA